MFSKKLQCLFCFIALVFVLNYSFAQVPTIGGTTTVTGEDSIILSISTNPTTINIINSSISFAATVRNWGGQGNSNEIYLYIPPCNNSACQRNYSSITSISIISQPTGSNGTCFFDSENDRIKCSGFKAGGLYDAISIKFTATNLQEGTSSAAIRDSEEWFVYNQAGDYGSAIVSIFRPNQTLTVQSRTSVMGKVSENSNGSNQQASFQSYVKWGDSKAIYAFPSTAGYKFDNWTSSSTSCPIANANSATIASVQVKAYCTVTANFSAIPLTYNLTLKQSDGGTISTDSATSNLTAGTTVALKANPATGYFVQSWESNSTNCLLFEISTDKTTAKVKVNGNCEVKANFSLLCGNGSIDSGEVCDGSNLNQQTCATQGFDSGTLTCKIDCSGFDTSSCTTTEQTYFLKVDAAPQDAGTVSGSESNIPFETWKIISATVVDSKYDFNYWKSNSTNCKIDNNLSKDTRVQVNGNCVVTANFSLKNFSLTKLVSPAGKGSISTVPENTLNLDYGSTVNLSANPISGYVVDSWSSNPSSDCPISGVSADKKNAKATVNGNCTITATFSVQFAVTTQYSIVIAVNDSAAVLTQIPVPNAYSKTLGSDVNLSASPKTGYKFDSWSSNSSNCLFLNHSTETSFANTSVKVNGNCTVTANFLQIQTIQTINPPTGGSESAMQSGSQPPVQLIPKANISITYTGSFFSGKNLTFTATGDYSFFEWNFGDGAKAQGKKVNHSYVLNSSDIAKTFNVSLTVRDYSGNETTIGTQVIVMQYIELKLLKPNSDKELEKNKEYEFVFSIKDFQTGQAISRKDPMNAVISAKFNETPLALSETSNGVYSAKYLVKTSDSVDSLLFVNANAKVSTESRYLNDAIKVKLKPETLNFDNPFKGKIYAIANSVGKIFGKAYYSNGSVVEKLKEGKIYFDCFDKTFPLAISAGTFSSELSDFFTKEGACSAKISLFDEFGNFGEKSFSWAVAKEDPNYSISLVEPDFSKDLTFGYGQKIRLKAKLNYPAEWKVQSTGISLILPDLSSMQFEKTPKNEYFLDYTMPSKESSISEIKLSLKAESTESASGTAHNALLERSAKLSDQIVIETLYPTNGTVIISSEPQKIIAKLKYPNGAPFVKEDINAVFDENGLEQNILLKYDTQTGLYKGDLNEPLESGTHVFSISIPEQGTSRVDITSSIEEPFDFMQLVLLVIGLFFLFVALHFTRMRLKESSVELVELSKELANQKGIAKRLEFEYYKRHITADEYKKRLLDAQQKIASIEKKLKRKKSIGDRLNAFLIQKASSAKSSASSEQQLANQIAELFYSKKDQYNSDSLKEALLKEGVPKKIAELAVEKIFK